MIRQISVENFKCFSNEKTFRLVPLTILSGLNGAGKSSLIQALLMLKSSTSTRDNVVPDDIFPHKIGAISQLIAQDFVGERQITLSAQTDKGDWSFSYKLSGSSKQRLKVIGDPQQCPDPLPTIQYLNAEPQIKQRIRRIGTTHISRWQQRRLSAQSSRAGRPVDPG